MIVLSIAESIKFYRGQSDIVACNNFNGVSGMQMPTDRQINRWAATTVHDFSVLKNGMLFYTEHTPENL